MNVFSALATGSALLLIAALPAAGQPLPLQATGAPVQLAAQWALGVKKEEYARKSRDDMREWQAKLEGAREADRDQGRSAAAAGLSGLHRAWAKAEAESLRLETANGEGWNSARSAFEKASKNLADAWRRAYPENE
jgi:hypothetical protein